MTRTVSALLYRHQLNIFTKVNMDTVRSERVKVSITTSIDQLNSNQTFWKTVVSILLRFLFLNSHLYASIFFFFFFTQTIAVTL